MNKLKSFFPVPYIVLCFIGAIHSVIGIVSTGTINVWLGSFIATAPAVLFFARLFLSGMARSSRNLPSLLVGAAVGSVLTLTLPPVGKYLPLVYALGVGLAGSLLYVFWYSKMPQHERITLKVGTRLPDFTLQDHLGQVVNAHDIRKSSAVLMFFRGNWCPLCMAQIREVAASYKALQERGIDVYLISPQPAHNTQSLATKFSVPLRFLVDSESRVAEQLGLVHKDGVPKGVLGYDSDTVMPTVILTNANGEILFADITDNYRVRPEPETFIRIFDEAKQVSG